MNKKIVLILCLVLVSSFLLVGCGDDEAEINSVLDDYSEALVEGDMDVLQEVLVSDLAVEFEGITDEEANEFAAMFEELEFNEREIEIDGEQAEVNAVVKTTVFGMTEEEENVISLVKEDGNWKLEGLGM